MVSARPVANRARVRTSSIASMVSARAGASASVRVSSIARMVSVRVPSILPGVRTASIARMVSVRNVVNPTCDVLPLSPVTSLFPFFPANWRERVRMETAWLTDVVGSKESLAEERVGLLQRPLRRSTTTLSGLPREFGSRLSHFFARLTQHRNAYPIYQDQTAVTANSSAAILFCDTRWRRFYTGGRVGIVLADYSQIQVSGGLEVVFAQIQSVQNTRLNLTANLPTTIPAGALVFPMMDCEMSTEAAVRTLNDAVAEAQFEALEISGCSTLPESSGEDVSAIFDYYLGFPIVRVGLGPNWEDEVPWKIVRDSDKTPSGRSRVLDADGTRGVREFGPLEFGPFPDRASFWDLLQLHDSRRGRQRPLWLVNPQIIWEYISYGVDGTGPYVDVKPYGYNNDVPEFYDYIVLVTTAGNAHLNPIVSSQAMTGPTRWRVRVQNAFTGGLSVKHTTSAHFVRQANDSLTEEWGSNEICLSARMAYRELLKDEAVSLLNLP